MVGNNIKLIFRQFRKQKAYVLINFIGLTIGLSTAMLIGLYVMNEWKADAFIPNPDRTFRLIRTSDINLEAYSIGVTSAPFATALEQDYPDDVEETLRVLDGNSLVSIEDQKYQEENYLYVDPNFITFFDLPLLHGDPQTALNEAHRIILTKELALKYFDSTAEAMGKILKIDDDYDAIVSGVFDDLKYHSHLKFDLVESNQLLANAGFWTEWWSNSFVTYLRLAPNVSAQVFNSRLPNFMDKYFGADFERTGAKVGLQLEPIKDTYFAAETRYDPVRHGNKSGVLIFLFAAILLIVVACINYINLTTATAITRSKEMAIYQVLGSGKKSIVKRVLTESALLTTLAIITALQLTVYGMPWFENIVGTSFSYQLPFWELCFGMLGLGLIVSLASGLYPGFLMASFQPKNVLQGHSISENHRTSRFRKSLVVFQYVLSTVLLISTFVIYQQLDYLKTKNLGFDKDHVLVVQMNNREIGRQRDLFRNRMLQESGVKEVAFLNGIPGGFHDATAIDIPMENKSMRMRTAFVDFNYVQTLGFELVAGRNLNAELASDSTHSVLLNEQAVKDIGITNEAVIGQTVKMTSYDSIPRKVVGVLKDYHFTSLHDQIEPLIISYRSWASVIAIKTSGNKISETIAATEKVWGNIAPAFPLNYSFLDERLANQYESELRQGSLFAFFAVIAIFIACLGIFGLAAFSASIRTKEIGIRKILGASVIGIVQLLSKDFLKLVTIACLIAIPFAWYLMNQWLNDFAYKIEINWQVFVYAGLLGLAISLITVSVHSIRAALANPVESLRDE